MTTWHGTRGIERDPQSLANITAALLDRDTAPEDFGAVGDGASHPAFRHIGTRTLADLQRYNGGVYAFADGIDNEMDYLAWQAALYAGGMVRGRHGAVYVINHNLVLRNGTVHVDATGCSLLWTGMPALVADGSTPTINPGFD